VTGSGGTVSIGGTVFQLLPPASAGGAWTESVIHDFTEGGDWGAPNGVILGSGGALYGTAAGASRLGPCVACGDVFQLAPPATPGGPWTETILHSFTGGYPDTDGSLPDSAPVLGPHGELYGATYTGGVYGFGAIYEMEPPSSPGAPWKETILYSFTDGPDGGQPNAVTLGPDGNLYGTTEIGGVSPDGARNQGTIFQLVLP